MKQLGKEVFKRYKQKHKTHKHHTIMFDTWDKIDWHLRNLWELEDIPYPSYKTQQDIIEEKHIDRHRILRKRKRKKKDIITYEELVIIYNEM